MERDDQGRFVPAEDAPVPPPEPSYREKLAELDAEEEAEAKALYEARVAAREARKREPLVTQAGLNEARGGHPGASSGRPLDRPRDATEALDPARQRALRDAARAGQVRYW